MYFKSDIKTVDATVEVLERKETVYINKITNRALKPDESLFTYLCICQTNIRCLDIWVALSR